MKRLILDSPEDIYFDLLDACISGDAPRLTKLLQDPHIWQWLYHKEIPCLRSPLSEAVRGGNPKCVKILLSAGCIVDIEDKSRQTPLFIATSEKNLEIMKILLYSRANPEGSKKNRKCPLIESVRYGFLEGMKLLLDYGAKIEPFDHINPLIPGWPLRYAVTNSHLPSFIELIKRGAVTDLTKFSNPVQPSTVARWSIPHAILKYAKDKPEFVSIFQESGGNLLQCDANGLSPLDPTIPSSPSKDQIFELVSNPLTLQSQCRNAVNQYICRKQLLQIPKNEIPRPIISFLTFNELNDFLY